MSNVDDPVGGQPDPADPIDYEAVQRSPEFQELKRRFRSFVFPVSVLFFAWFILYVLLAAYAHDFMAIRVFGNVNIGILLGLGQFVSTFAITMIYVRFANRRVDPLAVDIRADLESRGAGAEGGDRG